MAEDDIFDCTGSHVFNDQVSIACWKEGAMDGEVAGGPGQLL